MVTQSQTWLPGKDYPDREEWLLIRQTQRGGRSGARRYIYAHPAPQKDENGDWFQPARPPMMIGINHAKRMADVAFGLRTGAAHPANHGSRQSIVRQRHAYYRRAA